MKASACTINGKDVSKSFVDEGSGSYSLTYTVAEGDQDRPAGSLPISCVLTSVKGFVNRVFTFTTENSLEIDAHRPSILRAEILHVTPRGRPVVGIGSVIIIKVEAGSNDANLMIFDCFANFPTVAGRPPVRVHGGRAVGGFMELGRGLYTMEYTIQEGDQDRDLRTGSGGALPFSCGFRDLANNTAIFASNLRPPRGVNMRIDAHPPIILKTYLLHSTSSPARMGSNVTVGLIASERSLKAGRCLLDNFDAAHSFDPKRNKKLDGSGRGYFFSFTVAAGQGDWLPGGMPVDCALVDEAGNRARTTHFTDGNRLAGNTRTPGLSDYLPGFVPAIKFLLVGPFVLACVSSKPPSSPVVLKRSTRPQQVCVASRVLAWKAPVVGLPVITGYLAVGMLAGPFLLSLVPEAGIRSLRFVDEMSLGFIALCAGHKLHIQDLRAHLKSVVLVVVSLTVFEYAIGCATVYSLAPWIGFMKKLKRPQILAIAFMVMSPNALVVARFHLPLC